MILKEFYKKFLIFLFNILIYLCFIIYFGFFVYIFVKNVDETFLDFFLSKITHLEYFKFKVSYIILINYNRLFLFNEILITNKFFIIKDTMFFWFLDRNFFLFFYFTFYYIFLMLVIHIITNIYSFLYDYFETKSYQILIKIFYLGFLVTFINTAFIAYCYLNFLVI